MPAIVAAALVFYTSGTVLALEILAGRLLAPYVGVTLQSYTGIIGTVLAGIALGAWLGGRLADRHDPRAPIGPVITAGGALTVLSAVTPIVVKLRLDTPERTGEVVGRLSALGTAGALVGTFVTGFVLIAALPTRPIIRGIGASLVVVGLAVWIWMGRHHRNVHRPTGGVAALALVAGLVSFAQSNPSEYESAYYCAFVVADPDRAGGQPLWLDTLRNSYVDVDDPTYLQFSYAQTMSDLLAAIAPAGQPLDVVHIGGGGLSLPRYLAATRPGTTSTVLELDPLLPRIAQDELGYTPSADDGIDIITGDARLNITDVPPGSADLVIGDAFGGVSVPWHLTTREFLVQIRNRLTPGGWYALNLIDNPPNAFARAEVATLQDVFGHVLVLAPPDRLTGDAGGNFIVVASTQPLPMDKILDRNTARGDDEEAISSDRPASVAGLSWEAFVDHRCSPTTTPRSTSCHAPPGRVKRRHPAGWVGPVRSRGPRRRVRACRGAAVGGGHDG